MPVTTEVKRATATATEVREGEPEQCFAMLPSQFVDSEFADDERCFVIVIPDTGASAFVPAYVSKAGKNIAARFVIAEMKEGTRTTPLVYNDNDGEEQNLAMANGNHALLPLDISLFIQARPKNGKATTIAEALGKEVAR